jgi:signal transduction histidine kinase/CheY-like chemotaxis protein
VTSPLRILLLEDNTHDAELIQELLEADHFVCEVTRVQTRAEFVAGLENVGINLILADYKLPSFDGLSALKLALDAHADLPFIFVSGSLGEEVAIEAVKIGATDYVVKSRLSRLVPSVQRALREAGERAERKKAEEAFRRSEMYLAEAQRLSHTGSFGWNVSSGELFWSEETFRIFEYDRAAKPTLELTLQRVYPDDRPLVQQIIDRASKDGKDYAHEYRLQMPSESIKYLHVVAHAERDKSGELEFIGAVMDVTAGKRAEEALHKAQAELAHVTRITTLGELTTSIAHEVSQPLAGVVANAEACLGWLDRETPNLDEARRSLEWIIKDSNRAGEVTRRVRALATKTDAQKAPLDVNHAVNEAIVFVRRELLSHQVSVRMELSRALPVVLADRTQLQQVIINLVINAIEAMQPVTDRLRELVIQSHQVEAHQVQVTMKDCGVGISAESADRLFNAFFTTKSSGMGMGLSICRSIIAAHGGRLWAEPNLPHGATFHFTLPSHQENAP